MSQAGSPTHCGLNRDQRQPPCKKQDMIFFFFFFKHVNFEIERPSSLPLVIGSVAKEMAPASGKTGAC